MTGHAHSRQAYRTHRTCQGCRGANATYQRDRRRTHAYGRPTPLNLIDARPAREHLLMLAAAGIGWRHISRHHPVSASTVRRLLAWDPEQGGRLIPAAVAQVILAVPAETALVPSAPAWRLVRGMTARGYSMAWIGSQMTGRPVRSLQLGPRWCTREALERLRVAAEWAAIHPGPSERARRRAARSGWSVELIWTTLAELERAERAAGTA